MPGLAIVQIALGLGATLPKGADEKATLQPAEKPDGKSRVTVSNNTINPIGKRTFPEVVLLPLKSSTSVFIAQRALPKLAKTRAKGQETVTSSTMTRKEWLKTKPITSHTENVWIDVYENDKGQLIEHDLTQSLRTTKPKGDWRFRIMSRPKLPAGATPDKFKVLGVIDHYNSKDIIVSPTKTLTHGQVVQTIAVDGAENQVGVLAINRIDDQDNARLIYEISALRWLNEIKQNQKHPFSPYLSYVNCSFGNAKQYNVLHNELNPNITPSNINNFRKEIINFLRETYPYNHKVIAEIETLVNSGIKFTRSGGNVGGKSFHLENLAEGVFVVGAKNPDNSIASYSSESQLVNAHALGDVFSTLETHPLGFTWGENDITKALMKSLPKETFEHHGKNWKTMPDEQKKELTESNGFIVSKFDEKYILNQDGSLNRVVNHFDGTSFAAPRVLNQLLRTDLGLTPNLDNLVDFEPGKPEAIMKKQ